MSSLSFVGVVGVKIIRFGDGVSDTVVGSLVWEEPHAELAVEVFIVFVGGVAEAVA